MNSKQSKNQPVSGSELKSCDSGGNKGVSIVNVLSTQGDSSSNGTAGRKNSTATKVKSNSISSGSNERNSGKKAQKNSNDK